MFFSLAVALLGLLLLNLGSAADENPSKPMLLRFTGPLAALLAFGALYLRGIRWNDITSRRRTSARELLICGLACAGSAAAVIAAVSLLRHLAGVADQAEAVRDLTVARSASPMALSWLGLGLVDPLTEEIAFRGILLTAVSRRFGVTCGIAASTIAFALLHFVPPWRMAPAAILGLILSLLYVGSRSIWMPIVGHASWNVISLVAKQAPIVRSALAPTADIRFPLLALFIAGLMAFVALRALSQLYATPRTLEGDRS